MIVCHCRVVSDREIQDAVACGAAGVCDVARRCGAGSRCGGCLPVVREVLARRGLPTDDELTPRDIRRAIGQEASVTA